jgi:hypothetical protein
MALLPLIAIGVALFVVGALTDVAWSRWSLTVNRGHQNQAALWAFLICLPAALTVNAYVHYWWFVAIYALGAALGTWATVVHSKREKKTDVKK